MRGDAGRLTRGDEVVCEWSSTGGIRVHGD